MEIKVFWTETALKNLEEVFEYYKFKASLRVARKLVKGLVKSTIQIQNSPNIGKKEELLIDRKFVYRFLIVGNYKIIYWTEDNYIKIATVFDCRQNPKKIRKV
ncbi:MAG: type II toxin-antitoxin system RelE/ParE family toxin [Bacteroidales bacterium]|jgi:toxin ParE1/3/4|nr:type II toxin-antitoxin system RelE/ParE family toxin [Bacteroidales bacterium]